MTREDAIENFKDFIDHFQTQIKQAQAIGDKAFDVERAERDIQTFEMAIKALENHDTFMKYAYSQGKHDALSQEPTEICCATCKHERLDDINYKCEFEDECLVEGKRGKYEFAYAKYEPIVEQEPCDDAISREAALEKMADYVASGYADSAEDFEEYSRIICQLPSVTQKSGKWIERQNIARTSIATAIEFRWTYECSKCGHEVRHKTRFCASCGAKMESGDKE